MIYAPTLIMPTDQAGTDPLGYSATDVAAPGRPHSQLCRKANGVSGRLRFLGESLLPFQLDPNPRTARLRTSSANLLAVLLVQDPHLQKPELWQTKGGSVRICSSIQSSNSYEWAKDATDP